MGKQCWSQAVLESGSWGHSVLQTPALVKSFLDKKCLVLRNMEHYILIFYTNFQIPFHLISASYLFSRYFLFPLGAFSPFWLV